MSSKKERRPVRTKCGGVSATHQSFQDECDINLIMKKFETGALLEHVNRFQGRYGDFTETPQDFAAAMQQVMDAKAMFMTLPAKLRKQFDNDPGEFVEFLDGADEEQLREVGLLPTGDTAQPVSSETPRGAEGEPETPAEPAGA